MSFIRMLALAFLVGCPVGDKGDVVAPPCDLVGTEAMPADEALPGSVAEGLALYDAMEGAWTVALACADETAPIVTITVTTSGRDDFELETWEGDGCGETGEANVVRGTTALVLADWIHEFDAAVDTSVEEDGTVRLSGSSSSVELEVNAWEDELHGTIRVPWSASAKDVGSETSSDPMDCTFEGWAPAE